MKVYLVQTGIVIEPFGDPMADTFLGGETMGTAVERACTEAEVSVEKVATSDDLPLKGDYLLAPDNLFLTRSCIRTFVESSGQKTGPGRLALSRGAATNYLRPLQQVAEDEDSISFDLYRIKGIEVPRGLAWNDLTAFLSSRAEKIVIDPNPKNELLPQSRPGPPWGYIDLPRTTMLAADIRHWVHIVWLNHLLPWVRLEEYWQDHPGLGRSWRSRGSNRYRQAARRSVIGKNCRIHPTAYVEGSILGDGVSMGPFTCVRDSIISDGVEISDHSKFQRCVVGEKCHTLNDSYFIGCTFYSGSTLASFMLRNSVLGRRVFITSGVMFWDEAIEEPVEVIDRGQSVATGRWQLGGCAGHECILGTRAIFLPGRAVPNRTMIVMRPEEGVVKLPAQAARAVPHVYHQGNIQPLEQVLPDWKPLEIDQ
jgi:acetyltransferase-like isoleucine patch superfamily enzyme